MTMLQTHTHSLQSKLSFYTSTQKSPIMNIIFDLNGVIFDNVISYSNTYPYGTKIVSPVNPGTIIRLLNDCKQQGHRLFIVSNMLKETIELLKSHPSSANIFSYFEDIILGPVVGIKKPDPRIFTYLLYKHKLNPEHSVFIDDQKINLDAAEKVGISKGIQCTDFNFTNIRTQLRDFGAL